MFVLKNSQQNAGNFSETKHPKKFANNSENTRKHEKVVLQVI